MPPPRESAIVKKILERLNAIPGCVARKRHGSAYSVAGDPDIYGCVIGYHFEMEVKVPGEEPTRLQRERLQAWLKAGSSVCWVTSADAAVHFVRDIIDSRGSWNYVYDGSEYRSHLE